jgi:hypothetical protein
VNTSILWIGQDFFVVTLTSLIAGKSIAFLWVAELRWLVADVPVENAQILVELGGVELRARFPRAKAERVTVS